MGTRVRKTDLYALAAILHSLVRRGAAHSPISTFLLSASLIRERPLGPDKSDFTSTCR